MTQATSGVIRPLSWIWETVAVNKMLPVFSDKRLGFRV